MSELRIQRNDTRTLEAPAGEASETKQAKTRPKTASFQERLASEPSESVTPDRDTARDARLRVTHDPAASLTRLRLLSTTPASASAAPQSVPPPPYDGRTGEDWRTYVNQWRGAAEHELGRKRGSDFPDKGVEGLIRRGGGPVHVGHWSSNPESRDRPVFFQNFPSDGDIRAQLYTFPRDGKFVSFEVAGNFHKAYGSNDYLDRRLGTSSALGFPDSGTEPLGRGGDPNWPPFRRDAEVSKLVEQKGELSYQKFENGYLVDLGGGRVQAFRLDGARWGGTFPAGTLSGPTSAPIAPIPNGQVKPEYRDIYQPFNVTGDVAVPSRLGVHWGPLTEYRDEGRIRAVVDKMKASGAGFSTVIVEGSPEGVAKQEKVLRALLDAGIEPVVRVLPPGGQYDRTMDQLSRAEMDGMADATRRLKDMGVKMVQLDNEPNIDEGGKQIQALLQGANDPAKSPGERADFQRRYDDTMNRYAENLAYTMGEIEKRAPGTAVGFGSFSPGRPEMHLEKEMFEDLMHRMRYFDDQSGGRLLDRSFLAVHPYTIGHAGDGIAHDEYHRDTARAILGRPSLQTLATEGGNPPTDEAASNRIVEAELRRLARDPQATQCLWIAADQFLTGGSGTGGWESHALIKADGREIELMKNLQRIYRGEPVVL